MAWEAGADLIEADVWLYRGRLEVRHTKTVRGLPLLWDRWSLGPGWRARLLLEELLAGAPSEAGLMLDLKGNDPRLPDAMLGALDACPRAGHVAVCSRNWPQVDALAAHEGITAIHSVGRAHRLRPLLDHLADHGTQRRVGLSIHQRLLDAARVRELRSLAAPVITWPVNDAALARTLVSWGVEGVISDDLGLVREIVAARRDGRYTSNQ